MGSIARLNRFDDLAQTGSQTAHLVLATRSGSTLLELAGHAGDLVSELFAESDEIGRSPFDSGISHGLQPRPVSRDLPSQKQGFGIALLNLGRRPSATIVWGWRSHSPRSFSMFETPQVRRIAVSPYNL